MKQYFSFLNSNTRLISSLLLTSFFILSCNKDELILSNEKNSDLELDSAEHVANAKAYFEENPSIIPDLNFVIEYRDYSDSANGLIITRSGEIIEYHFINPISSVLSPGTYNQIIKYFDDAHVKHLYQTDNSFILNADSISLRMMDEYSKITDSITFCNFVPPNHQCNLYQIQHAETNESCYPMRILEGKNENDWYVSSPFPAQILSLLDSALSESGGLNLIYWEHYGF
ncbi:MAG: hypothetical protein CMP67_06290 [Flavobacteriales bacterium]|nr:hypothetical protein [Flavobacteriales bacterium]|tara:strand:- start:4745 stop:5431 length:687 start_codon:yes stop_codon:yes gene_type:complete